MPCGGVYERLQGREMWGGGWASLSQCRLPGPCSQARVLWLPLPILEIWEPEKLQAVLERGMGFCLGLCFGQPLSDRRSWTLSGFLTFIISWTLYKIPHYR